MIEAVISFLGIFLGILLAKYNREELEDGRIYFMALEIIILIVLVVLQIYFKFDPLLFLLGITFGIFLRHEYFYFHQILS